MNGIKILTNEGSDKMETTILALVGIIMASVVVPISTIAMLKANPANHK